MIEKGAFIAELEDFMFERSDMSIGEVLYSILRPQNGEVNGKISSILSITDSDMVKRVEKAKDIEND